MPRRYGQSATLDNVHGWVLPLRPVLLGCYLFHTSLLYARDPDSGSGSRFQRRPGDQQEESIPIVRRRFRRLRPAQGGARDVRITQLLGSKGNPRENIFIYYCPNPERSKPLRFVRNERWKLYGDNRLFDVANDVLEKKPVTGPASEGIRKQLQAALDQMPNEGQSLMKFD